jgi:hypothetical protein
MGHATLNGVEAFGFVAGFFTLVLLGYRRHLRTRLPVIAVGLACCGVYGFLDGDWTAGFVLSAVTASEFRLWWHGRDWHASAPVSSAMVRSDRIDCESRIHRMFGSA